MKRLNIMVCVLALLSVFLALPVMAQTVNDTQFRAGAFGLGYFSGGDPALMARRRCFCRSAQPPILSVSRLPTSESLKRADRYRSRNSTSHTGSSRDWPIGSTKINGSSFGGWQRLDSSLTASTCRRHFSMEQQWALKRANRERARKSCCRWRPTL